MPLTLKSGLVQLPVIGFQHFFLFGKPLKKENSLQIAQRY